MLVEATEARMGSAPPLTPTILIPKVDGPDDVAAVRERWRSPEESPELVAVIESARGLARVEDVAAAPGVDGLLFGGLDLSLDLRTALDWEALLYARSRAVLAARMADVALMDTPHFDLGAEAPLTAEARRARRLGFDGKAAIHPRQVAPILAAFSPSEAEVAAARRVLEAGEQAGAGVFALDGVMVDRPALEAARRVVASAGEATPDEDRRGPA
jgi:citrate lyase beta subunit